VRFETSSPAASQRARIAASARFTQVFAATVAPDRAIRARRRWRASARASGIEEPRVAPVRRALRAPRDAVVDIGPDHGARLPAVARVRQVLTP